MTKWLTKEEFIKKLIDAGWTKEDAEKEWEKTMRGDYDEDGEP